MSLGGLPLGKIVHDGAHFRAIDQNGCELNGNFNDRGCALRALMEARR